MPTDEVCPDALGGGVRSDAVEVREVDNATAMARELSFGFRDVRTAT